MILVLDLLVLIIIFQRIPNLLYYKIKCKQLCVEGWKLSLDPTSLPQKDERK
jgi:hypothetical protein